LLESPATVLITGATGGLGGALARHYARPGRSLVLHGRDEGQIAVLAKACREQGAQTSPLPCDLRDAEGFKGRLEALASATPIDLAIVNAGVSSADTGGGEAWEDIERMLDVNLRAAIATVSALLPSMRQRGCGQIALISSLAGWHGLPITPTYSATKAGLKAYGEALRARLAPEGIAVNVVLPGFVKTPMSDRYPAAKPFMISAEDAAARIARGLARDQARIAFPQPLAFGAWLLSVMPAPWSQRIARRMGP
jgi:short-subunit dehydrogenase